MNTATQIELNMSSASVEPVNRRRIKDLRTDELERQRPLYTEWTGRSRDYPRSFRRVSLP